MNFNISEDDAKKLLNTSFGVACDTLEFSRDIRFQGENRRVLQSGNAHNITYRLGRTEERYDETIHLYDTIMGIVSNIRRRKTQIDAPIFQIASRQEYVECPICHRPVQVTVQWQGYYWQPTTPVECYDCNSLTYLTDRTLLFASIKKAKEKGAENALEKSVDWLAKQFGNDADEIRQIQHMYYAEQRK